MYKLDRTIFKAMSAKQADKEMRNYKNISVAESFKIAMYLNSIAFNFPMENPPKIDRTAFRAIPRNSK